MEKGYLYIARGEQYLREAECSCKSLRAVDANAHVTLITDQSTDSSLFDSIAHSPTDDLEGRREGFLYKAKHLTSSPYDRTFFIDTDTYFLENCRPLFDLLDAFDLCVAQSPVAGDAVIQGAVKVGLQYISSAVLLYKKTDVCQKILKESAELFEKNASMQSDDFALTQVIAKSGARVWQLPSRYHAKTDTYFHLSGKAYLLHARHNDFERIRRRINVTDAPRVWDPLAKMCITHEGAHSSLQSLRSFKGLVGRVVRP